VSEIKETTQDSEVDATRATARLPGLEIEVVHRRSPSGDAEQISINLQAVPSFEAFGRFIETANPFACWLQAAQMVWFPWLETVRTVMLPWGVAARPKIGSGDSHRTPV
jgi:hypothetical protein